MLARYKIYLLLFFATVVCLLLVQYYWMKKALDLQRQGLERELQEITNEVAQQLQEQSSCFELFASIRIDKGEGLRLLKSISDEGKPGADTIQTYYWNRQGRDTLWSFKQLDFGTPADLEVELRFEYLYPPGSAAPASLSSPQVSEDQDLNTIHDFRQNFKSDYSFFDYVDTALARDLFLEKLQLAGLNDDHQFAFWVDEGSSPRLLYASVDDPDFLEKGFKATLFSESYFINPVRLTLFIPALSNLGFQFPWITILSTAGISLLIFIIVWLFVRLANRQGRLAKWRTDFIDNMVHEFKTPITNVGLAVDTISKYHDNLNENQENLLTIIKEENKRQKENIDNILHSLTYEDLSPALHIEEVDLNRLIRKVIRPYQLEVESLKGDLNVELSDGLPLLHTDEVHLTNILDNLLDNAVKYSISRPCIFVSTVKEDRFNLIVVEDKGLGMSRDQQSHVFEKFYRAQQGNLHNVKGFGLGLSYVKWALEQLNGKIEIFSKLKQGTKINVRIPNNLA